MIDMNALFGLAGKTAVVTGGYGHLGAAMVEALAAAGAAVAVVGRDEDKAEALCETLHRRYSKSVLMAARMDVTDSRSIVAALDRVEAELGALDVLVNNAARALPGRPEEITDALWREGVSAALDPVFLCTRETAPRMASAGGGSIVNIGSMYGLVSPDFGVYEGAESFFSPASYGAAKAALLQLTRYCAVYYADRGIRVNAISPGPFPSSTRPEDQEFIARLTARVPLRRIGRPADMRGAVVFLASDAAAFVTGHDLVVDGGWTIT